MNGTGNDYIVVNSLEDIATITESHIIQMSDRHFGIGSDGVILIKKGKRAQFLMEMYNADGTYSQMCGNGLRCVARYLYDQGLTRETEFPIETGELLVSTRIHLNAAQEIQSISIDMGKAQLTATKIPVRSEKEHIINEPLEIHDRLFHYTAISMGNPHCVIFLSERELKTLDIEHYGPLIEKHPNFPQRINVEFASIISKSTIQQRTWERGSGETLACGSGACAVLLAAFLTGQCTHSPTGIDSLTIRLLGGELEVSYDQKTQAITLTGPAQYNFEGIWNHL